MLWAKVHAALTKTVCHISLCLFFSLVARTAKTEATPDFKAAAALAVNGLCGSPVYLPGPVGPMWSAGAPRGPTPPPPPSQPAPQVPREACPTAATPAWNVAQRKAAPRPAHAQTSKGRDADLQLQKQLNKELILSASAPDAAFQARFGHQDSVNIVKLKAPRPWQHCEQLPCEVPCQVLQVATARLGDMNGVNLSTALHRISRACHGNQHLAEQIKGHADFLRLVRAAERMLAEPGHMSAKCCTVIAWSCASLRFFRTPLFSLLADSLARSGDLGRCEPYEITNVLWAYAALCKSRRQIGRGEQSAVQALAACAVGILGRRGQAWKPQVLMSALVSLAILPCKGSSLQAFTSILDELDARQAGAKS